jgi:hypothetical protein
MSAKCLANFIRFDLVVLIIFESSTSYELLIMQFSLASYYLISVGSKYSHQHPVLKH